MLNKLFLSKFLFLAIAACCLTMPIASPLALIFGFIFTILFKNPFQQWMGKAINVLLKSSIVGLGFGILLQEALSTSKDGFILTALSIFFTLVLGFLLGKLFRMNNKLTHLVSSGTAICGGSAIAAVSQVIGTKEKEISMALGVVFLLNSIALLIFPTIGSLLELNQQQFGLWCAVAIHDTSSVVGAAMTYGEESLRIATTAKLARTLWIIPLAIISMYFFKSEKKKIKIPWFILFFLIAILLNSYLELPEVITYHVPMIAKRVLIMTLFFVGSSITIQSIKTTGLHPLLLGVILWLFISVGSIVFILNS